MKQDLTHGLSFLAMCGAVSIVLVIGSYAVDVYEYGMEIERKAAVHDEWAVQTQMIAEDPGMKLVLNDNAQKGK